MKGRILVADDEENIRFSSRVALRRAGYHVDLAENGEEALALIDSGRHIDFIVLDLNMPRISGKEVLTTLRGKGIKIPILAISGLTDSAVAREIIELGCLAFMEKPFTPDELVHAVEKVLAPAAKTGETPVLRPLPAVVGASQRGAL